MSGSKLGKATELLCDTHRSSIEAHALAIETDQHGDVVDRILAASKMERQHNRELVKKLIRILYFLVKKRVPHTAMCEELIELQIKNGNEQLREHKDNSPSSATYLSKISFAELLRSISCVIEQSLLSRLKESPYFSNMADESTDIASMEELSICARWLENGQAVEHFLGIVHVKNVGGSPLSLPPPPLL